ncbi:MAG: hypothetical protein Q8L29_04185 [archaeon]|nr:hypothetical protein [archaeon]
MSILFYVYIVIPIVEFTKQVVNKFISFFTPKVISFLFLCLEIIGILFVIYLYTRIVLKIKEYLEERRSRENIVENIESKISSVLKTKLEELKYSELRDFASEARRLHDLSIEYKELKEFSSDLRALLTQTRRAIEKEEHKIKIAEYEQEEYLRKREIEELDKRIYLKQLAEEDKKREMLNRLKAYEHPVFKRDNLSEKQVVALLEHGYSKVNEYDIIEKKLMTFLVDPSSNHSKTHTFLVWNVVELLKRTGEVDKIREHESVDADITFKYKSKMYALEIETGTLLGKKKQTQEKVDFLNMKYPNRWFFVVSNKTLLPKYSKLGPSTQRNGVLEKLQKMLK